VRRQAGSSRRPTTRPPAARPAAAGVRTAAAAAAGDDDGDGCGGTPSTSCNSEPQQTVVFSKILFNVRFYRRAAHTVHFHCLRVRLLRVML